MTTNLDLEAQMTCSRAFSALSVASCTEIVAVIPAAVFGILQKTRRGVDNGAAGESELPSVWVLFCGRGRVTGDFIDQLLSGEGRVSSGNEFAVFEDIERSATFGAGLISLEMQSPPDLTTVTPWTPTFKHNAII
jgi:hypothetical protein